MDVKKRKLSWRVRENWETRFHGALKHFLSHEEYSTYLGLEICITFNIHLNMQVKQSKAEVWGTELDIMCDRN